MFALVSRHLRLLRGGGLSGKNDKVRELLQEGYTVKTGWVSFEEPDYALADMYQSIWDILETYGDGNFKKIDTDLSY